MKVIRLLSIICILLADLCSGAQAQTLNADADTTKWYNRTQHIGNVDITARRSRYSRRDNPAVELMRRVIAAKHRSDLRNRDYYRYDKYQKTTLAVNDITPTRMQDPLLKDKQWLLNQVEYCPYNRRLVLPVQVEETVTENTWRRQPRDSRTTRIGTNTTGVADLLQTGDALNVMLADLFTDVNIYDNQIRLLQQRFTSPISDDAINFYRYYIEDTLYIGSHRCYHLSFLPANQQDFGFRGQLFVLADSTYQVRRCIMTIPQQSDVNFVSGMQLSQEFTQQPDGTWALTADDLFTELRWATFMESFVVVRNIRLSDYAFTDRTPALTHRPPRNSPEFWAHYRRVDLTPGERTMPQFMRGLTGTPGFRYIMGALRILIENYIETGSPSKVDIGPVNTLVSANDIDGLRTRLSLQTTANLDSNLFLSGYVARGWRSHNTYYSADLTWSFNKKQYLPDEFPRRTLSLHAARDVMSPSDRFKDTDKDNVFAALKWTGDEHMMYYNRQQISFQYETRSGLKTILSMKTEHDEPIQQQSLNLDPVRTTELHAELQLSPGQTYINTKQRRLAASPGAPYAAIGHTIGLSGPLGGQHAFHLTEATLYRRLWLDAGWGYVDCRLHGAIQWSRVPPLLLIMPEANLSYLLADNTFELVGDMEFLTDRYASLMVGWDLSGKLLNRVPLLRRLKWREWIAVRCMWGDLTQKNATPQLTVADSQLFPPYCEVSIGIHNIFQLLHVEYVRRLNYLDRPNAHRQGLRFTMRMTF